MINLIKRIQREVSNIKIPRDIRIIELGESISQPDTLEKQKICDLFR
ncbi:MAG: hypothetical protein ACRC7N_18425 [Clostridium sp.]